LLVSRLCWLLVASLIWLTTLIATLLWRAILTATEELELVCNNLCSVSLLTILLPLAAA
jgi:hypothetical protein